MQSDYYGLLREYPDIVDADNKDYIRKCNGLMSFYFHIAEPEKLSDGAWMERVKQIEWLARMGMLGIKL